MRLLRKMIGKIHENSLCLVIHILSYLHKLHFRVDFISGVLSSTEMKINSSSTLTPPSTPEKEKCCILYD